MHFQIEVQIKDENPIRQDIVDQVKEAILTVFSDVIDDNGLYNEEIHAKNMESRRSPCVFELSLILTDELEEEEEDVPNEVLNALGALGQMAMKVYHEPVPRKQLPHVWIGEAPPTHPVSDGDYWIEDHGLPFGSDKLNVYIFNEGWDQMPQEVSISDNLTNKALQYDLSGMWFDHATNHLYKFVGSRAVPIAEQVSKKETRANGLTHLYTIAQGQNLDRFVSQDGDYLLEFSQEDTVSRTFYKDMGQWKEIKIDTYVSDTLLAYNFDYLKYVPSQGILYKVEIGTPRAIAHLDQNPTPKATHEISLLIINKGDTKPSKNQAVGTYLVEFADQSIPVIYRLNSQRKWQKLEMPLLVVPECPNGDCDCFWLHQERGILYEVFNGVPKRIAQTIL